MEPRLNELLHVNKNLWCKCCLMVLCYFKTFKFEILTSKQHFSQLVSEKAISANLGLKVQFTIVLTFLHWLFRGLFCVIIIGPWSKSSKYRPLPSSKNSHFQNEAKCTTFLVKMSFICMRMKNHFHIKGWALNLVLIQRPGELGNGLFAKLQLLD